MSNKTRTIGDLEAWIEAPADQRPDNETGRRGAWLGITPAGLFTCELQTCDGHDLVAEGQAGGLEQAVDAALLEAGKWALSAGHKEGPHA